MIDPQRFREVMASFPSGVVVLTAFGLDSLPRGLTVSAFCAVSLGPPLALACIDKTSNTLPAVQQAVGKRVLPFEVGAHAVVTQQFTGDDRILMRTKNVLEGAEPFGETLGRLTS